MRLTGLALVLIAFVAAVGGAAPAHAAERGCDDVGWQYDCPTVENSGSQVDIGAGLANPRNNSDSEANQPDQPGPAVPAPAPPLNDCTRRACVVEIVGPPEVTIEDLASFRPAAPSLVGEPAGFGLLGAPTNVFAAASEQYISGTLLGWEVTVRFTPATYVFDYGDGSTARSPSGGTSWAGLGQLQFSPTSTSHVYRERGTFPVTAAVQYSAAVDFGSGTWRPVTGFVTATSGAYDVRVVEARTALVAQTCLENPTGPGC